MTRDIKFRAWDKEGELMYSVQDINFCGEEIDTFEMPGDWIGFDQIELMQFTGLHDKNGKEIYEGDIIAGDDGLPDVRAFVEWCDGDLPGFVMTWYDKDNQIDTSGFDGCNEWCTVIGNIYENPSLLEVKP